LLISYSLGYTCPRHEIDKELVIFMKIARSPQDNYRPKNNERAAIKAAK